MLIGTPLCIVSSNITENVTLVKELQASPESSLEPETLDLPSKLEYNGDENLNVMTFTPTASQEEGLYFVCRRGLSVVAYFGASVVYYLVNNELFTLEFLGSNHVIPEGEQPTGSVTNYFYGSDSSQWKTGLNDCAVLRYSEIYLGIDLVYKIQESNLKYEFIVSPDTDSNCIKMRYVGIDRINFAVDQITIEQGDQRLVDSELKAFQERNPEIDCTFSCESFDTVGFNIGEYDHSRELVIDPVVLAYSTLLGGSGNDFGYDIKVENGFIYVTGKTSSFDFPVVNAYNSTYGTNDDCFIMKLAANGQSIIYSTFIGGDGADSGTGLSVVNGEVYFTGWTESSNFPNVSAYDPTYNGNRDCFVGYLAWNGQSLHYSTYIGGSGFDMSEAIAVGSGLVYITGFTYSTDYPTSITAMNTTINGGADAFVSCVHSSGISYSTYLGGSLFDRGHAITVNNHHAIVAGYTESSNFPVVNAYDSTYNGGSDCFIANVSIAGEQLIYSSFLGGAGNDYVTGLALSNGHIYLVGCTQSSNFPTANAYDGVYNGGWDVFVAKLSEDEKSLIYSTFIGGSGHDQAFDIAIYNTYAHVLSYTESNDFPLMYAYDSTFANPDCALTILSGDGAFLISSSYFGGNDLDYGFGIEVKNGYIYITGATASTDFPTQFALDSQIDGDYDLYVAVFSFDTDMDSIPDWTESMIYGTNPFRIDSDNDNFLDAYEILYGSNPLDPMSYPAIPQAWYDTIYENLDYNSTLIQNLLAWSAGNASLLQIVMQQLDNNATLLQQVIVWLDGNHTAIGTLFTQLDGNATLLFQTVSALNGNSTLIQNLLTWSAGNETLLLNVIDQVNSMEPVDLSQVIEWLDGNHTAIQTLFTYMAGNASLLLSVIDQMNGNATKLDLVAALVTQNTAWLQTLNASVIGDINEIRAVLNQLGVTIGDTDYDGLDDLDEIFYGTDILCIDTDCDNLNDAYEVKIGTDPTDDDSDNDTYLDGAETIAGTNPLDAQDYPGSGNTSTTSTTTSPSTTDQSVSIMVMILVSSGGLIGLLVVMLVLRKRMTYSTTS